MTRIYSKIRNRFFPLYDLPKVKLDIFWGKFKNKEKYPTLLGPKFAPHGRSEKTALANPPGGSNKIDGNIYQHDGETIE